MKLHLGVLIFGLLASGALAKAPTDSPRPDVRPGAAVAEVALRRPSPRPRLAAYQATPNVTVVSPKPARVVLAASRVAVRLSPRPDVRPANLKRRSIVRAMAVRQKPGASQRGFVCGDPAIQGRALKAIAGRLRGCGVAKPVRVTSVDGVRLSQPATLNCNAAKALKRWVAGSVKPAVGKLGGGVASLKVVAHYSCRTRNNKKGAKISEHGRGKAIDIAAIVLKNGVSLTVLKGWGDRVQSKILRAVHKQACGPFGTVLGPNADRYHQDHFHLDVARHRGGSYCR